MIVSQKQSQVTIINVPTADAFVQGGNAFGADAVLGTTDDYDFTILRNNTIVTSFLNDSIGIGGTIQIFYDGSAIFATGNAQIFDNGGMSIGAGNTIFGPDGTCYFAASNTYITPDGSMVFTNNGITFSGTAYMSCRVTAGSESLRFVSGVTPPTNTNIAVPANILAYGNSSYMLGGPSEWIRVSINGTSYKIPCYS